MGEDGADANHGGLGNEGLVGRYISLHHQSSFAILFLGPSAFLFVCLSLVPVLIYCHSSAVNFLSCSKTNRLRQDTGQCNGDLQHTR